MVSNVILSMTGHALHPVPTAADSARIVDRLRHVLPPPQRPRDGAQDPGGVQEDTAGEIFRDKFGLFFSAYQIVYRE